MELTTLYYKVFEILLKFSTLVVAFIILYQLFTTNRIRKAHHKMLRIWLHKVYKVSWFNRIKQASYKVLALLNYIYGKPSKSNKLITKEYFNERSWKTSFSIALFYISLFIILIPIFLFNNDNFITLTTFILIFIFLIFGYIFFRKKINSVNVDTYRNSFYSLLLIFSISAIFNTNLISHEIFMIFLFVAIPIIFVWKFGVSGLMSFFLSLFLYIFTILNITVLLYNYQAHNDQKKLSTSYTKTIEKNQSEFKIVDKNTNNKPKIKSLENPDQVKLDQNDEQIDEVALLVNVFFIFVVYILMFIFDKKKYKYKNIFKVYIFITLILIPIHTLIYTDILQLKKYIYILYYIVFFWIFIWGIIIINSFSDLLSSNVSRWLFYKIQSYKKWKDIIQAILLDIFVGTTLVVITALLLSFLFFTLSLHVNEDFFFSFQNFSSVIRTTEITKEAIDNNAFILQILSLESISKLILNSLYSLPSIINIADQINIIDYNSYEDIQDMSRNDIKYILWYLYISVLVPTILHFIYLMGLIISKLLNTLVQSPARYIHRLLIENYIAEDFFGKSFSKTSRANIIIGTLILMVSFMIFILVKHIFS